MYFFVVLSPGDSTAEQMRAASGLAKSRFGKDYAYACIEFGQYADHPHLNCIIDSTRRSDSLRRTLLQLWDDYVGELPGVSLFVKKAPDVPGLVCKNGGYLTKEDVYELLHDGLWTQQMQDKYEKRPKGIVKSDKSKAPKRYQSPTFTVVGELQTIDMCIEHFKTASLEPSVENFKDFQRFFARRYYCHRICWQRVYQYMVLNVSPEDPDTEPDIWYRL